MLDICLPFPQQWYLSTCLQCSQMCCTARESLSLSASLCCSMTKSWWPPSSLTVLIPPSFSSIAIIPNGCRSSARRSWSVLERSPEIVEKKMHTLMSFYEWNNIYFAFSFVQFNPSQCQAAELSTCTTFTALMKVAYSRGPSALLEDDFRKKAEETLSCMPIAEYPVAIRQLLLYIKSTLETVGTVRA